MDLLSDVLRVVHLQGAIFFTAEIAGRWAVQSPAREELARLLGMREECVALFHLVDEGECQIALGRGAPITVGPGSIVIFPRADPHRIASDPAVPPIPIESIFSSCSGPEVPCLRRGTDGAHFRLICGYLRCDQRFNPLVGALPPLLIDRPEAGQLEVISGAEVPEIRTEPADGGGWLAQTFRYAVEEAQARRPGSAVMLPRLAELMYVEVLRRYMRLLPAGRTGWLAACRDPQIGHALRRLHEEPARGWRVEDLAREVGLSRSVLGQRFQELVGEPPMRYLAQWRIHLAEQLLHVPELSVAQVAARVGFDSPIAFHRAFKRYVGSTPAAWRESHSMSH